MLQRFSFIIKRKVLTLKTVMDADFNVYGRILDVDTQDFVKAINARPATPQGEVVYEPSVAEFEQLPLSQTMEKIVYGQMPMEFGHCSGWNEKLNALEYHRSSEIDIAATDLVLMLGRQQDITPDDYTYDTKNVEFFLVPAGTAVELYATTLHFAPCGVDGKEFRCGVVLPKHTNEELTEDTSKAQGEERLLFAVNKWLIAHEDSGLDKSGAWIGLKGKNLSL